MSDTDFPVVIYHNAKCGTSRNTIAMVEAAGYAPTVILIWKRAGPATCSPRWRPRPASGFAT